MPHLQADGLLRKDPAAPWGRLPTNRGPPGMRREAGRREQGTHQHPQRSDSRDTQPQTEAEPGLLWGARGWGAGARQRPSPCRAAARRAPCGFDPPGRLEPEGRLAALLWKRSERGGLAGRRQGQGQLQGSAAPVQMCDEGARVGAEAEEAEGQPPGAGRGPAATLWLRGGRKPWELHLTRGGRLRAHPHPG